MCRIAGFWDFNYKNDYDIRKTMDEMRDTMSYGGPDDAGSYTDKNHPLALGHRRLSILDLSPLGHQPMGTEDESLCITYNGEVYNFREIKERLERKGYKFKSRSDTEVILKAYEEDRMDCLLNFRGMWAFAIWDRNREKLILCRDRVGIKPLYWYYKDGLFMFTSELKAFHKHPKFRKSLDFNSLALYLQLGYITAPYTIFKDTHKLQPGYYLEIDNKMNIRQTKYWDVEDSYREGEYLQNSGYRDRLSENEITDELESILTESCTLRMISDVPIGIFLSGGTDSSVVTALLQRSSPETIKTFTIGFHEKAYNEAGWAKKVSDHLRTDHTELYCTADEVSGIIQKLPEMYDEPFGDSSAIPTYLLSKLARSKVKVSLSADGGDELFCGYTKYNVVNIVRKISKMPFMNTLNKAFDLLSPEMAFNIYNTFKPFFPKYNDFKDKYKLIKSMLNTEDVIKQNIFMSSVFMDEDLKELGIQNRYPFLSHSDKYDCLTSMMIFDSMTYLPDDIMVKVDRASMNVALEVREPLLDHKILEYMARVPITYKYRNGIGKYILKKILYKYVPGNLVNRPKQGFTVPIYALFKNDLEILYKEYLNEKRLNREGIFNAKAVGFILKGSISDRGINHNKLWTLLMFEMWKEKWI
ncbi:MAG: asparagine synthase (glutamine-hydrolyzing) [Nitrospirae bacterium RBG_16_43_11]|nr:MAG: asparagine synthase (glutamine-hydrolyzing) [Nitrospirae bacterium RBG_16_43_11]